MTFRLRHLLAALTLHAALLGLLLSGVQCSRPPQRPTIINAVLLDPSRQQAAEQKRKEKEAEQRRQDQARKEAQEKQRQQELQRRKAEEQKKQAEALQRKKAAEDAQRRKLEDTQRQKQAEKKKKAGEESRRKKEQQETRERQEQAQREIQEQARVEDEMRQETSRRERERQEAALAASEREKKVAEWSDALERHIQKFWNRPASAPDNFKCKVRVQLLPDGSVTSAKIVSSCGSPPLDKSVEDAAYRASPLPMPADPSVFDRDIYINFHP